MEPKTSSPVAAERRMDLASLFCSVARHGPAVVLAAVAAVSVLAAVLLYRTVRGKWRRRKSAGAGSSSPGESTDVSDEGSSDIREDVDLVPRGLQIRHRRVPTQEEPPPGPPQTDPEPEPELSLDSSRITDTCVEEAAQNLLVTAVDVKDNVVLQSLTDEDNDPDRSLKTEPVPHEAFREEEKVLQAEWQEVESVTEELDVEEDVLNSSVCFKQACMTENSDDYKLQDEETSSEPASQTEDEPPSRSCCSKGAEHEENILHPDVYQENNHISQEEEEESERQEAEEECPDKQQSETQSLALEEETDKPSPQLERCDDVIDEQVASPQEAQDGAHCQTFKAEDHFNNLAELEIHPPQLDEHQQQEGRTPIEEEGLLEDGTCVGESETVALESLTSCLNQSDELHVIDNGIDGPCSSTMEEEVQISDIVDVSGLSSDELVLSSKGGETEAKNESDLNNIPEDGSDIQLQAQRTEEQNGFTQKEEEMLRSCGDECENAVFESATSTWNQSAEAETKAETTAEAQAGRSGSMEVPVSSADHQEPQTEVEEVLDNGPHLDILGPDMKEASPQDEISSEKNDLGRVGPLVEESVGFSCYEEPKTGSFESKEKFDNPMFDLGVAVCEELSFIPTQSDQIQNNGALPEVTADVSPDATQNGSHHIPLLSLERSHLTWSSCGFRGESGISSMAVSPESQDGLEEFDATLSSAAPPVMDCNAYLEEQAEAQNGLFADDAVASFIHEDTVALESGPSHQDWALDGSSATNEDSFGSEVEESYNSAVDQFVAQITANMSSTNDEKQETNTNAPLVVVENKEKKEEKVEDEDHEKTEISIMEATMDTNEWITEGNYQVLPWMNLSDLPLASSLTKTDSLPTEDLLGSSLSDVPRTDAEVPPLAESIEANAPSLAEENSKRVLAVPPMPQNVAVTFQTHYLAQSPHQKVAVTGNHRELGDWKGFVPLGGAKDGHWSAVVGLPAESRLEWKFVVVDGGEVRRWEECGNRLLDTGSGDQLVVRKSWGFL